MLAGNNEPNVENEVQMVVLDSYHQTFVDAVRSTGGKNHYHVLVVQGPSTDIMKTRKLMTRKALENGILPFYWDNGGTGRNGCALFDRKNLTRFDQQALDAISRGAEK